MVFAGTPAPLEGINVAKIQRNPWESNNYTQKFEEFPMTDPWDEPVYFPT